MLWKDGRTDGSVSISLRNFVDEGIITFLSTFNTYRITAKMKVETEIIANISAIPGGRAGIFVIMCVTAFRTDLIVFICDVIMCFTSDCPINLHMRVTNFISSNHQRENVQLANKLYLLLYTVLYLNVLLEGDPTGKFIFKINDERDDFILPLFSNIHVSIAYTVLCILFDQYSRE
jgi:hypothetical protein